MSETANSTDIWTTEDGRKIRVDRMSDRHLVSTIRFLRANVDRYRMAEVRRMGRYIVGAPDGAADACIQEANRLNELSDDAYLAHRFPVFTTLLAELQRENELTRVSNAAAQPEYASGAPAIESDPAVSEPMTTEFCNTHDLTWLVAQNQDGTFRCVFYQKRGYRFRRPAAARADGVTPSEARARAIVATQAESAAVSRKVAPAGPRHLDRKPNES